jgi:hypothetical protein
VCGPVSQSANSYRAPTPQIIVCFAQERLCGTTHHTHHVYASCHVCHMFVVNIDVSSTFPPFGAPPNADRLVTPIHDSRTTQWTPPRTFVGSQRMIGSRPCVGRQHTCCGRTWAQSSVSLLAAGKPSCTRHMNKPVQQGIMLVFDAEPIAACPQPKLNNRGTALFQGLTHRNCQHMTLENLWLMRL